MGVYLTARAFAFHTGRCSFLSDEGVVENAESWHLSPFAAKPDAILIGCIDLHRIYHTHRKIFNDLNNRHATNSGPIKKNEAGLNAHDQRYFVSRVQHSFRSWYDRFEKSETDVEHSRFLRSELYDYGTFDTL